MSAIESQGLKFATANAFLPGVNFEGKKVIMKVKLCLCFVSVKARDQCEAEQDITQCMCTRSVQAGASQTRSILHPSTTCQYNLIAQRVQRSQGTCDVMNIPWRLVLYILSWLFV